MYPVSQEYQNKIKENNRTFKATIQIQHSTGVLDITDKDIIGGSIIYTEGSQAGEEFTIGGTVASTFDIKLVNKPEYANVNFEGATIIPQIGLLLRENIDVENYFLSAPQSSEFVDGDGSEIWEYVPIGRFNVDESKKLRGVVEIKAIDNMINLDIPYSLSKLSYPATLYQIYVNICNVADVTVGTTTFPNKDYVVQARPEGDYTLRDILGHVSELSGTFARMNRNGALELSWYKDSGISLDPSNRFNFVPREDLIQIKGVKFETEDTVYLAGTDEYVVDLSDNPLLQDNYNTVLPNIFNNIKDTVFTPFESSWQGNPALQAGDIVTQTDRDGNIFTAIVTNSTYKYRGASFLSGKGLPLKAKGYKGSTNKKIANIIRKEIIPIGAKLTTLEKAQLDATELIANMLGGYAFYEADGFYVADNPILVNAQKVWKWGIGGFGYSSTGVNGTYTTAITADGSIVAELVSAGIITADMVQTGLLSSEDGSSWFNLNNGEINIKEQLKFVDGKLTLSGVDSGNKVFNTTPTVPYIVNDLWKVTGVAGVDFRICIRSKLTGVYSLSDWVNVTDSKNYADLIKNLTTGTAIMGGTTTIDNTKVRVNHGSTIEYSEVNALGFFRQWLYGKGNYLNDMHIVQNLSSETDYTTWSTVTITLPERFRGRGDKVKILLIERGFTTGQWMYVWANDGTVDRFPQDLSKVLRETGRNFDLVNPEIYIRAYISYYRRYPAGGDNRAIYRDLTFDLVAIGE